MSAGCRLPLLYLALAHLCLLCAFAAVAFVPASVAGFYYHPRIDKKLLADHSEGLIGLAACLGGEVAQTYEKIGQREEALDWMERSLRAGLPLEEVLSSPKLKDFRADPRWQDLEAKFRP